MMKIKINNSDTINNFDIKARKRRRFTTNTRDGSTYGQTQVTAWVCLLPGECFLKFY